MKCSEACVGIHFKYGGVLWISTDGAVNLAGLLKRKSVAQWPPGN